MIVRPRPRPSQPLAARKKEVEERGRVQREEIRKQVHCCTLPLRHELVHSLACHSGQTTASELYTKTKREFTCHVLRGESADMAKLTLTSRLPDSNKQRRKLLGDG